MDATTRNRQPQGAPNAIGGQFATEDRTESDVRLDALRADTPLEELSDAALHDAVRSSVRHHAFRADVKFVGEKDMVQDTIEHILRTKRNRPQTVVTKAYARQIAFGVVAIAARGNLRAEDRKAMGIFTRRVGEIETERGYRMSGKDKDELAAQIRDDWPDKRHRPSANFVEFASMRTFSLDAPSGLPGSGSTLADRVGDHNTINGVLGGDDLSVDPDTQAALVLSGELTNKKELKARAWSLLSEVSAVPDVTPGAITKSEATKHRCAVADAGGVLAAVKQWDSGDPDPAVEKALFAPFGALDEGGKDRVCELLRSRPAYAEVLYDAAVRAASTRSAGRVVGAGSDGRRLATAA